MQKVTPFLWYDNNAEEAVNLYMSVFKDAKILSTVRYDEAGAAVSGRPAGSVMTIDFQLEGQRFTAINAGLIFKFNESISFVVSCDSQEEIDRYWNALSAVPESEQCGWLKDRFGLSWQIVPSQMGKMMSNPETSQRVMQAMLQMKKIDIAVLQKAADGE